ncbi:hypothetical protein PHSY_005953 [Pseudozyma hubeiensis SY62]|uniref:Uncharacterized protein n=1 Tax=Pseudozyma hubeiensis (strain SY62) TaxID=1305764 RepID=R9PJV1_PSEHS|nr:hypothetical protein PHSY_005953 [Pseudozyma hubeiensis SY62]GAC98360.1 hypothetical protein PHSY_005953 [Pseudozyma hubeiensis SY62]
MHRSLLHDRGGFSTETSLAVAGRTFNIAEHAVQTPSSQHADIWCSGCSASSTPPDAKGRTSLQILDERRCLTRSGCAMLHSEVHSERISRIPPRANMHTS